MVKAGEHLRNPAMVRVVEWADERSGLQHAGIGSRLFEEAGRRVCGALDRAWINPAGELVLDGDYAHAQLFGQFGVDLPQSTVDIVSEIVRVAAHEQLCHQCCIARVCGSAELSHAGRCFIHTIPRNRLCGNRLERRAARSAHTGLGIADEGGDQIKRERQECSDGYSRKGGGQPFLEPGGTERTVPLGPAPDSEADGEDQNEDDERRQSGARCCCALPVENDGPNEGAS